MLIKVERPNPFNMKTESIQSRKEKIAQDRKNDEARLREAR
jgi:hypothetical protein